MVIATRSVSRNYAPRTFAAKRRGAYLVAVTTVNAFGALLAQIRKRAGLSQEKAAKGADISENWWSRLESGAVSSARVSFENLRAMANAIGATPLEKAQLFKLAGPEHAAFYQEMLDAAIVAEHPLPSMDAFIDTTPELDTPEDRVALKHVARGFKKPPAEGAEESS